MAIEIERRTEVNKLLWPIAFLIFSLIVVVTLLVSYFYFDNAEKEALLKLSEKQQGLVKTAEEKALEDSLSGYQAKISMFEEVFKDHRKAQNALLFVEKICHPDVYFSKVSYDLKTGGLSLDGSAADFLTVSQQVIIFKQEKDIVKSVSLENLTPTEDGSINFSLKVNVDKAITLNQIQ